MSESAIAAEQARFAAMDRVPMPSVSEPAKHIDDSQSGTPFDSEPGSSPKPANGGDSAPIPNSLATHMNRAPLEMPSRLRPATSAFDKTEATMSRRPDRERENTPREGHSDASTLPNRGEIGRVAAFPPYLLRESIGVGGCGQVYDAVQTALGRVIAVKRPRLSLYDSPDSDESYVRWHEQLFRQEAVTTALLEHPNIVPVHDLSMDEHNRPLLAMKLVRGKTWDALITEDWFMPTPDFLAKHLPILIDVSQAVAFAHSRGILHRDLKPHQVMVGEFGEVLLMDWGLSVVFDFGKLSSIMADTPAGRLIPRIENCSNPAGTPAFMAPEQADPDPSRLGPATDIYLLGGTLYVLLTGSAPHRMKDRPPDSAALREVANEPIERPEMRNPDVQIPTDLADLTMRCMEKEPGDRISAQAFIDALKDHVTGAGRRRESRMLSATVATRARTSAATYKEYSTLDSMIERSLSLWPENPEGLRLRQKILVKYAQLALANDDLTLARAMADRLAAGAEREEIMQEADVLARLNARAEVEAEEAELDRRAFEEELKRLQTELGAVKGELAAYQTRFGALDSGDTQAPV